MVNPTSGKDYSSLQQNNPYRNFQYTPSFWDRVLGGINDVTGTHLFRTPQEKYAMDMANQARAYDAQIAETHREELYNSPEEQAQRMREAGINPDLQGSGINGGQASPFDNQSVTNMPSADFGEAQNAMNIAGQIFARVSQIPSSVMSLIQSGVQIKQNSLSFFNDINEAATNFLIEHQGSDSSWWTNMSKDNMLHYIMNLPQIKVQFPLASSRRAFAAAVYDRSRAVSTSIGSISKRGEYLRTATDPMNTDESLIVSINKWQAEYNRYRLELLARTEKSQLDNDLPESGSKIKSLENDMRVMELEGLKALIEHFQSLLAVSGNKAYVYASSMTQSILDGEISKALAVYAAGNIESGISSGKDTPLGTFGKSVSGIADALGVSKPKSQPSSGVVQDEPSSEVESLDTSPEVAPEDDISSGVYWKNKWKSFKSGVRQFFAPFVDEWNEAIERRDARDAAREAREAERHRAYVENEDNWFPDYTGQGWRDPDGNYHALKTQPPHFIR